MFKKLETIEEEKTEPTVVKKNCLETGYRETAYQHQKYIFGGVVLLTLGCFLYYKYSKKITLKRCCTIQEKNLTIEESKPKIEEKTHNRETAYRHLIDMEG